MLFFLFSSQEGRWEECAELLAEDVSPLDADEKGWTSLHWACCLGYDGELNFGSEKGFAMGYSCGGILTRTLTLTLTLTLMLTLMRTLTPTLSVISSHRRRRRNSVRCGRRLFQLQNGSSPCGQKQKQHSGLFSLCDETYEQSFALGGLQR